MLLWLPYLFSFNFTITDDSSRASKACHVTIPADDKAHETEQCRPTLWVAVEVGSVCGVFFNVLLAVKTA